MMQLQGTPPHRILPYTGSGRTVKEMLEAADGPRGAQSLKVRLAAEDIIRWLTPRDKRSQVAAIRDWFMAHSAYVHDPIPTELVRDPERTLFEIRTYGRFLGDCDDAATFLVGMFRSLGIKAIPIRVAFTGARRVRDKNGIVKVVKGPFTHVLAVAVVQNNQILAVDPVAHAKTWKMLRQARRVG